MNFVHGFTGFFNNVAFGDFCGFVTAFMMGVAALVCVAKFFADWMTPKIK